MLLPFFLLLFVGCENVDTQLAVEAGLDAFKAVTLSDEQVRLYARQAAELADGKNQLAPPDSQEARRLAALLNGPLRADGNSYDVQIYLTDEVNAFAMADGTIRLYSGLMKMLSDQELLFVIGHEMGHVARQHIRKKLMLVYAASAVRKGVAAQQEGTAGDIARSVLGDFAEALLNAQFSQQEEREADDYGLAFVKSRGQDGEAAVTALRKLATLGSRHHFLSSHPAPEKRASRLRDRLDGKAVDEEPSGLAAAVWAWLREKLAFLAGLVLALLPQ
ncbi:M48 family metalloprotease [Candidatus Electronema sp. TJ]|uniref:M48 family metalloprotease n=1 Tax=Candidatus Electronema sp. TJ TaxID=3401573 RepID=UPI003AA8F33A